MFKNRGIYLYFIFAALAPVLILGASGLQITDLQVPEDFELDGEDALELDCIYDIEDADGDPIVKWYYNEKRFYQWIYPSFPKISDHWKQLLDTKYSASNESKKQFRGIRIPKPNVNLTGTYKCNVETWLKDESKEDSREKNMTVYVPAEYMNLTVAISEDEKEMELVCVAEGLYPKPELFIETSNHRLDPKNQTIDIVENNGTYDATITWAVDVQNLLPSTKFNCSVRIPGTRYIKWQTYRYGNVPDNDEIDDSKEDEYDGNFANSPMQSLKLLAVCVAVWATYFLL